MSITYTPPLFRNQFFDQNGNPLSGGKIYFYSAGSTSFKNIWLDLTKTNPAQNPMPLNSSGVVSKQYFMESGLYDIWIYNSSNELIQTLYNIETGNGSGGSSVSDHLVIVDSNDTQPGTLVDKIIGSPTVNIAIENILGKDVLKVTSLGEVSAGGSDAPGYLINKISNSSGGLNINLQSGKVDLGLDYTYIKSNFTNLPYSVWFSGSNGNLVGTQALTFGDPSRQAALYAPSIQAQGSMIVGSSGNAFWDEDNFYLRYPANNGIVQLSPDSTDKYIYAHNSLGNASIVTDKASFANLANNGVVFACEWPNSSEDQIFLHTQTGFSFNPSTNLLTTPKLSTGTLNISSLTTSGVLVNDSNGNITSTPIGNFTDDHLVFVDSLDTTPGYLGTKLAAGTNIGFSITTDSHGSKLWISARSNMLLNPTYIQANYTVVDTDVLVVNNSNNSITVTLPTPGSTYNGRLIIVTQTGSGLLTINTVSGGIIGNTPSISAIGRQEFRCLKGPDNNYYWFNR